MTTKELKARIREALEEIPESALPEILDYLSEIRGKSDEDLKRLRNLKKILEEDKVLLERLAQ